MNNVERRKKIKEFIEEIKDIMQKKNIDENLKVFQDKIASLRFLDSKTTSLIRSHIKQRLKSVA